ncbi:CBO0543 family protein [Brevibacillus nitrificans]|uniref:CBO0543 family protein n=1 Tax=Brevibacillus nitrificans TaxID=651560 RepID=UPI00339E8309
MAFPKGKAHEFVMGVLPKASDLKITFKVVWTPVASGLYYIYRPRENNLTKCFYFAAWISLLTLIDGLLAQIYSYPSTA